MGWACCRRRMVMKRSTEACSSSQRLPAGPHKRPRGESTEVPASSSLDGRAQDRFASKSSSSRSLTEPLPFNGLRRREVVRLLQQTLSELGYEVSRAALEEESCVALEAEGVTLLRQAVLVADWDEALAALSRLALEVPSVEVEIRFSLLEQKCLELHHNGDREAAEVLLQGELTEAASTAKGQEQLERVRRLFACAREDLEEHGWTVETSREALLERLVSILPCDLAVPPRRLSVLLWQALRYQQLHCLYHDANPLQSSAGMSVLEDYSYSPPPLPRSCVARLRGHTDEVWFAAVSQNGRLLASSSKDKTIVIWECGSQASFRVLQVLLGHQEPCSVLAWSPDDRRLLSASSDRSVRLWAPPSHDPLLVLSKHVEPVSSVAWLPDGSRFVSAGFDRCIFLWGMDGTVLHRWELQCRVQDLAVTRDGLRLLVVDSDRNLKVLDTDSHRELLALPESDAVTSVCASRLRDELLVNVAQHVSALQQGPTVRLWDLASRRIIQRYLGHMQGRFVVRSCFAGPREEMVISGSEDAQVYIWHRHYGSLLQVLPGHTSTVNSVCWTSGPFLEGAFAGPWLISASDDSSLRVWGSVDPSTECREFEFSRDTGEETAEASAEAAAAQEADMPSLASPPATPGGLRQRRRGEEEHPASEEETM